MANEKSSLLRIYAFSTIVSVGLIVFAGFEAGIKGMLIVLMLVVLEISLSFDNAIVNARILKTMSDAWQKVFLTVGILIAVFGVRIILPVYLVALAVGSSFGEIVDLALNHPEEYGERLHEAHPMIASFGGVFLLMIFLQFFFESRKHKWWPWVENRMEKIGSFNNIAPLIAMGLLVIISRFVPQANQETVLISGLSGMLVYLVIHTIDAILRRTGIENNLQKTTQATFKMGLIGFIYLEVIDASFSLDGVIGAFAITSDILLIAIGLGIGALYVRTITIHMLKHGVLDSYRYIEHGAHYAIGILAVIMLVSLKVEVPEVITGLAGVIVIVVSVIQSKKITKKDSKLESSARNKPI